MLKAAIVTTEEELLQIHQLNLLNLKTNLDAAEQAAEGFVTWLYSFELLQKLHQLAPSIIVKDEEKVAGYALTTLKEASAFHPDLETMFNNLAAVQYKNKNLPAHKFYCMGQICVAKEYRGKGIVNRLYQKHREMYGTQFDFLLTEVSTNNIRSIKTHEKIGFQTIYTYRDKMDTWNVIVWDWK
jgi:ribosomal protein S18 acetylase RimI-like enzyme